MQDTITVKKKKNPRKKQFVHHGYYELEVEKLLTPPLPPHTLIINYWNKLSRLGLESTSLTHFETIEGK